jgi:lipid-A-disaccharide synthase
MKKSTEAMSFKRILMIAGEASGDHHGGDVAREIKAQHPDWDVFGIAGEHMREAGVRALIPAEDMAFMGFVEVIRNLGQVRRAFVAIKKAFKTEKPDAVILIDYPGFNLRVAKIAKRLNIPVLYYISPQIWAWKKGRIHDIKRDVDHMAVVFPFEVAMYEKANVPVTFVGSPLLDQVKCDLSQMEARERLGLKPGVKTVALMPGSRKTEIRRMLPVMIASAKKLQAKCKTIQWILPIADTLKESDLTPFFDNNVSIRCIKQATYDAIRASDAVMCASGTATLEVALLGTPLVVLYKMHPLSFQIIKRLISIDTIGLCNIVAEKNLAREFVQSDASPKAISDEVLRLLSDEKHSDQVKSDMTLLREKLEKGDAAKGVTHILTKLLLHNAIKEAHHYVKKFG